MRPGVGPDGMPLLRHLLENLWVPERMVADREEGRLGALRRECTQYGRRIHRPGAIVKGEHDLVCLQEIVHLEVLKSESGTAGSVDLHRARKAQDICRLCTVR